jgi:hypothetical protein
VLRAAGDIQFYLVLFYYTRKKFMVELCDNLPTRNISEESERERKEERGSKMNGRKEGDERRNERERILCFSL